MDGYGWISVDICGDGWIWVDMGGHGRILVDMGGYTWIWVDLAGFGVTRFCHGSPGCIPLRKLVVETWNLAIYRI